MTQTMTYPYISGEALEAINDAARLRGFNVRLDDRVIERLKALYPPPAWENMNFPVTMSMLHNDQQVRTLIQLSDKEGDVALLDMDFRTYFALPSLTVEIASRCEDKSAEG